MEKERYKETQYMSLYKDLLRKNRGLFQQQRDAEDFADEAALLKEAGSSQRQMWLAGIGIGLLTFASLHYLPTYVIRRLGGEAKVKALHAAEQQAKKDGTAWIRKATGKLDVILDGRCCLHLKFQALIQHTRFPIRTDSFNDRSRGGRLIFSLDRVLCVPSSCRTIRRYI